MALLLNIIIFLPAAGLITLLLLVIISLPKRKKLTLQGKHALVTGEILGFFLLLFFFLFFS